MNEPQPDYDKFTDNEDDPVREAGKLADWILHSNNDTTMPDHLPIVSTYSNGKVAIHDAVFLESGGISLVQRVSWHAHNMFTNPAEVWSADFCGNDDTVLSCGDEGKVKLWDVRATNRPMHVLSPFDAGATCASSHPRHEYLVACGSYDETICLLDTRFLSSSGQGRKRPLSRSKELGGGIWRIKWHPYKEERMLVAAMHGGCRVVEVGNWETVASSYNDDYNFPNADDADENAFPLPAGENIVDRPGAASHRHWRGLLPQDTLLGDVLPHHEGGGLEQ